MTKVVWCHRRPEYELNLHTVGRGVENRWNHYAQTWETLLQASVRKAYSAELILTLRVPLQLSRDLTSLSSAERVFCMQSDPEALHLNHLLFPTSRATGRLLLAATACLFSLVPAAALRAQVVLAPPTPQVGSSNPVSAEPGVKRPSTTPCTVTLFTNLEFADFNNKSFTYTPPASCGTGPWAKVVFSADFTVTAGRQYDRTAQFYLGGVNVYFGTTAEPRAALSPSWHVERDITDLSALLKTSQPGVAELYNYYGVSNGVDYNGLIYANAQIDFYPASLSALPAITPDAVVPLANGDQLLYTTTDQLKLTGVLPQNTERAYLDVIAQSQSQDEFWYTNAPNDVSTELEEYGNTGFREVEVMLDGKPAGLAPVYPWIYTGGIDPYLWEPTVGVQTLDFKPYRVDLTPFVGALTDDKPHTLAVSVYNAASYFDVTGTLLLYLDHGATRVTGALTKNTLSAAPAPSVTENLNTDKNGNITGSVFVDSLRSYSLDGYVNTSHGKVETTVDVTADFGNYQTYVVNEAQYVQSITQGNGAYSVTHTRDGLLDLEIDQLFLYPLYVYYDYMPNATGFSQVANVSQRDVSARQEKLNGFPLYSQSSDETVNTNDTLTEGSSPTTHVGSSTASYQGTDSLGHCYSRTLASTNGKLTSATDGAACGGTNHQ